MPKKAKELQQAGITLIALVVTIIILLILAGVTISLVLGQNGLIARAQSAYDTQTKGVIEQEIQQAKAVATIDKTNPTKSESKTWLQIVRDYLSADTVLTGIGETTAVISKNFILLTVNQQPTGIQYNYKITEEELEFIADAEAAADLLLPELVDLESGELTFAYSEENPTNQNITVTVTINKQIEQGLSLAYKIGTEGTWQIYTDPIEVSENCNIYFTLYNGKKSGDTSSDVANVSNIDREAPTAVSFTAGTPTSSGVTLQATATDNGAGVQYFQYSTDGGTTWSANQAVTSVHSGTTEYQIEISGLTAETTYQIKIKAIDKLGYSAESGVQAITTPAGPKTAEVIDKTTGTKINLADISTSDYGKVVKYTGEDNVEREYQIFYNDTTGKYSGGTAGVWLQLVGTVSYRPEGNYNKSLIQTANSIFWKLNPSLDTAYGTTLRSPSATLNNNIKAAAGLSNPEYTTWKDYVKAEDKTSGAYAIGGVSAEMFCESYNQARNGATPTFGAKAFNAHNTYGYYFIPNGQANSTYTATDNGTTYGSYTDYNTTGYAIQSTTCQSSPNVGMYRITGNNSNCYTWLASPSANGETIVCYVYGDGGCLGSGGDGNTYAVRPAVFLPSVIQ